ncbi:hypothetical protein FHT67_003220 [Paenibacillus sp. BK720]|nr:hypothetical protein [Paenibacillus sp. BK720]
MFRVVGLGWFSDREAQQPDIHLCPGHQAHYTLPQGAECGVSDVASAAAVCSNGADVYLWRSGAFAFGYRIPTLLKVESEESGTNSDRKRYTSAECCGATKQTKK